MASCAAICLLILLQTIFGFLGLLVLFIGLIGNFFAESIWKMITPYIELAMSQIGQSMDSSPISVDSNDILHILKQASIPFIVLGAILFLLNILGCCGTCCRMRTALLLYGIILLLILSGQGAVCAIVGMDWPKYRSMAANATRQVIEDEYAGINSTTIMPMFFNFAMMKFECCGATSYTDMQLATNWERTIKDFTIPGTNLTGLTGTMVVPATCCRMKAPFPCMNPVDVKKCLFQPTNETAFVDKPCFERIDEFLASKMMLVICVVAGGFLVQLGIIILVFALYKCFGDDQKVRPV